MEDLFRFRTSSSYELWKCKTTQPDCLSVTLHATKMHAHAQTHTHQANSGRVIYKEDAIVLTYSTQTTASSIIFA